MCAGKQTRWTCHALVSCRSFKLKCEWWSSKNSTTGPVLSKSCTTRMKSLVCTTRMKSLVNQLKKFAFSIQPLSDTGKIAPSGLPLVQDVYECVPLYMTNGGTCATYMMVWFGKTLKTFLVHRSTTYWFWILTGLVHLNMDITQWETHLSYHSKPS